MSNVILYIMGGYIVITTILLIVFLKRIGYLTKRLQIYDIITEKQDALKQIESERERLDSELMTLNKSAGLEYNGIKREP